MAQRVYFDTGALGDSLLFTAPREIIRADTPEQVDDALRKMEAAQEAGHWLAGAATNGRCGG